VAAGGDSFLLGQFREFYAELARLKEKVARGDWLFAAEGEAGEAPPAEPAGPTEPELSPTAVWQTLLTLLERQALAARRAGGDFATAVYAQAQYVMAALADETFIHLEWTGREAWKSHLLEAKLFGSHRAGEVLFQRLDELLTSRDPVYVELARIYLLALGLGFEGKYRDRETGPADLAIYRRKLYHFIFSREPTLPVGEERLLPQAYAATLEEGAGGRLPYLRPWVLAFALVVTLWVAATHPLWRQLIGQLEVILARILT
jgi:type VI secretion system protein ImpK